MRSKGKKTHRISTSKKKKKKLETEAQGRAKHKSAYIRRNSRKKWETAVKKVNKGEGKGRIMPPKTSEQKIFRDTPGAQANGEPNEALSSNKSESPALNKKAFAVICPKEPSVKKRGRRGRRGEARWRRGRGRIGRR